MNTYLGDGVYADLRPEGIMLTTGDTIENHADNVIFLDHDLIYALLLAINLYAQKRRPKNDR